MNINKNNRVSGKFGGQIFSGVVIEAFHHAAHSHLTIKLDAPITVLGKGEMTTISFDVNADGKGLGCIRAEISKVAAEQGASEARARVVVKRATRAGIPASVITATLAKFDTAVYGVNTIMGYLLDGQKTQAA